MEPWEQRQWMNLTAEFLTGNIPVRYQLPLIEPLRDAMIPMIVPFIRKMVKAIPKFRALGEKIRDIIIGFSNFMDKLIPKFINTIE